MAKTVSAAAAVMVVLMLSGCAAEDVAEETQTPTPTTGEFRSLGTVSQDLSEDSPNGLVCMDVDQVPPTGPEAGGNLFPGINDFTCTVKKNVADGVEVGDRVLVTWGASGTVTHVEPANN